MSNDKMECKSCGQDHITQLVELKNGCLKQYPEFKLDSMVQLFRETSGHPTHLEGFPPGTKFHGFPEYEQPADEQEQIARVAAQLYRQLEEEEEFWDKEAIEAL